MIYSDPMKQARKIIDGAKGKPLTAEVRCKAAVELAEAMLTAAEGRQSRSERLQQAELARMMEDPEGKAFITSVTDQCFRSKSNFRVSDQLCFLIDKFGVPRFVGYGKRLGLRLVRAIGKQFSWLLIPAAK